MKSFLFKLIPSAFIIFFLFPACNNNADDKDVADTLGEGTISTPLTNITLFEKLTGTWKGADGKNFERWIKKEDSTFQSQSFKLLGNDTAWTEQVSIYQENNKWIFESSVPGQNDGLPVKFISTLMTDSSVQFSNPEHNFPTDIRYDFVNDSTVHAFVVGPNKKGGKDTITFNYTRWKK